jgi:hypothetical protein
MLDFGFHGVVDAAEFDYAMKCDPCCNSEYPKTLTTLREILLVFSQEPGAIYLSEKEKTAVGNL